MRGGWYILIAVALAWPAMAANPLQSCNTATNDPAAVRECVGRYSRVAQQHMEQVFIILSQRAAKKDAELGYHRHQRTDKLREQQQRWLNETQNMCEMQSMSAGGGATGEPYKNACLAEAFQQRAETLQRQLNDR